jgi:hypothetical protein
MMQAELKRPFAVFICACVLAGGGLLMTVSGYHELDQQWERQKQVKARESASLLAALADHQAYARFRPAYASILENRDRLVHNRIVLLNYLAQLEEETGPLLHSYSIGAARTHGDHPDARTQVLVADITIDAQFRHEEHLAEYLWHLEQQRDALLGVAVVDVALHETSVSGSDQVTPTLTAKIKLHWLALPVFDAS